MRVRVAAWLAAWLRWLCPDPVVKLTLQEWALVGWGFYGGEQPSTEAMALEVRSGCVDMTFGDFLAEVHVEHRSSATVVRLGDLTLVASRDRWMLVQRVKQRWHVLHSGESAEPVEVPS